MVVKQAQIKFIFILFLGIIIGFSASVYFGNNNLGNNFFEQNLTNINNIVNDPAKFFLKTNETIINEILQKYHKDHTYSKKDLFVCSDMATDLWNIIGSKGFRAKIKIGNIDNDTINQTINFTKYNHAWVMAEIDNNWFALETTGGFIAKKNEYPLYYRKTIEFNSPLEFKNYLDLIKKYNTQVNITQQISNLCKEFYLNYSKEFDNYNKLVNEWNEKYFNKPKTTESDLFKEKLDEQDIKTKEKENLYFGCSKSLEEMQKTSNETYEKIIDFED